MKFAEGGYVPDSGCISRPRLKLEPGEYIYNRDGRIWRVTDDGEQIELVVDPREEA